MEQQQPLTAHAPHTHLNVNQGRQVRARRGVWVGRRALRLGGGGGRRLGLQVLVVIRQLQLLHLLLVGRCLLAVFVGG